jgi:hypothetical protein
MQQPWPDHKNNHNITVKYVVDAAAEIRFDGGSKFYVGKI